MTPAQAPRRLAEVRQLSYASLYWAGLWGREPPVRVDRMVQHARLLSSASTVRPAHQGKMFQPDLLSSLQPNSSSTTGISRSSSAACCRASIQVLRGQQRGTLRCALSPVLTCKRSNRW